MKHEHRKRYFDSDESTAIFEKRNKKKKFQIVEKEDRKKEKTRKEDQFNCMHCGFQVICDREQSGVNNRNHCPRCLHSLHVDQVKAGDRKAECKSRMEPIGLTIKHSPKRYSLGSQGELMLIHSCKGCGKISINRIAADDNAAVIYNLFNQSFKMSELAKNRLLQEGILLLDQADLTTVYSQLFGWQAILDEFEIPANYLHTNGAACTDLDVNIEWQKSKLSDPLNTL